MKKDYPLSFYFKAYRILCKMLRCESLGLDDNKKIIAYTGYESFAVPVVAVSDDNVFTVRNIICKNAGLFWQKAIVKTLMKVLETCAIFVNSRRNAELFLTVDGFSSMVPKGTCIEQLVIEDDLARYAR